MYSVKNSHGSEAGLDNLRCVAASALWVTIMSGSSLFWRFSEPVEHAMVRQNIAARLQQLITGLWS